MRAKFPSGFSLFSPRFTRSQQPRVLRNLVFRITGVATCYFLLFPSPVFADTVAEVCPDPEFPTDCYSPLTGVASLFGNVVAVVAIIAGFLAFIALIAGGFRYITARGDPKAIAAAQGMITWAIIGLALIIISWLILVFIKEFTGVDVTTFIIKTTP